MSEIELTYRYFTTHQNSCDTTCGFFTKPWKVAKLNCICRYYQNFHVSTIFLLSPLFLYLHYHQNALICFSQPSKKYLVHIAQTTVVWTKNEKQKNGLDNQKNCDKLLSPVWRMIHLCSILLLLSLLIPFDCFIWLNHWFCQADHNLKLPQVPGLNKNRTPCYKCHTYRCFFFFLE